MSYEQSKVVEIGKRPTGIPSISTPGHWVVPPWPKHADVHTVVRRFLDSNPLCHWVSDADEKEYYLGYLRALDTAATHDLTCDPARKWYEYLRRCAARCAAQYTGDNTKADATDEKWTA